MNHLIESATAKLVSSTTLEINPVPEGHEVVVLPDGDEQGVWNPATKTFDPRPVKRITTTGKFLLRMTADERVAIRTLAKTDTVAEDFVELLKAVEVVDLDDQTVADGLNYLASQGAITAARVSEVLNG